MTIDRRNFISSLAGTAAACACLPGSALAAAATGSTAGSQLASLAASGSSTIPLFREAMQALDRHAGHVKRDRIAIADFGSSSARPRFFMLDLEKGDVSLLHVTHGSGSDTAHTGFLQSFSNRSGSNATSQGAYATSNYYHGRHGHSQRLIGLDQSNSNAMDRAIVLHSAWYAEPEVVDRMGKLGRSQGCFAFSASGLPQVFDHLGEGRLVFAGKSA